MKEDKEILQKYFDDIICICESEEFSQNQKRKFLNRIFFNIISLCVYNTAFNLDIDPSNQTLKKLIRLNYNCLFDELFDDYELYISNKNL